MARHDARVPTIRGPRPERPALLHVDLVEPEAQLLCRVERALVGAGDRVHPVHHAGHLAELAERAEDLAAQVHLEHAPDAADVHYRAGTAGEAERPGIATRAPLLLEVAVSVEGLDAAVLAVGDIEDVVGVDHDRMRRVELPVPGAALAPALHQVALLV